MAIQMIFCLETNKRANTDYIYIKETLEFLYQKNNQIKISPVYMDGKSKYQSKSVLREIHKREKAFITGETKVIYCIDTDEYDRNTEHANEFMAIQNFCEKNGYDFIWFCHDVEEVFQGKKIPDSQKVQEAGAYRDKKKIMEMSLERLAETTIRSCTSNLLCVLDQYLKRK